MINSCVPGKIEVDIDTLADCSEKEEEMRQSETITALYLRLSRDDELERPCCDDMLEQIEAGKVKTFVVKDMSQLGRDYLKIGFYTEVFFPEKAVRFIAINNGIDSNNQQDSDFTPF